MTIGFGWTERFVHPHVRAEVVERQLDRFAGLQPRM